MTETAKKPDSPPVPALQDGQTAEPTRDQMIRGILTVRAEELSCRVERDIFGVYKGVSIFWTQDPEYPLVLLQPGCGETGDMKVAIHVLKMIETAGLVIRCGKFSDSKEGDEIISEKGPG